MKDTQKKISDCIDTYKRVYVVEYNNFLKYQKQKVVMAAKHGVMKGTEMGSELRKLAEIPVSLDNLIRGMLDHEEWTWYSSEKGKLWLTKTYPEFLGRGKI